MCRGVVYVVQYLSIEKYSTLWCHGVVVLSNYNMDRTPRYTQVTAPRDPFPPAGSTSSGLAASEYTQTSPTPGGHSTRYLSRGARWTIACDAQK